MPFAYVRILHMKDAHGCDLCHFAQLGRRQNIRHQCQKVKFPVMEYLHFPLVTFQINRVG